jgi:glycosyltransferase involved in cell wall biosynthesis
MRPLRILQVAHSFPPHNTAGTEVYTRNLSRELAKRHQVFIFHRVNNGEIDEFEIIKSEYEGLFIYALNNTFADCASFEMLYDNKIITDKFARLLDEINPDVIHIQHLLFLSIGIIEAAKKKNIPIVFTLNDYWLLCPQGQLLMNNRNACRENSVSDCVKCMKYQLSLKKGVMGIYCVLRDKFPVFLVQMIKYIYFAYARFPFLSKEKEKKQIELRVSRIKEACAMVDIFLTPSRFIKEKFTDFGIPQNKIFVSPYGLNTSFFNRIEKIGEKGKVRFAFMGTLLPSKGPHILIKAFNRIGRTNAELKIYGSDRVYKGFESYLKSIKKACGNKNIHFMGGYKNEDIGSILSEVDVLVVPSIWYENAPLVIQESFLAQTPVIASRVGGIPELVTDGVNGLLFNPADIQDLTGKINYVIDNPEVINEFKKKMPPVKSIEKNAGEMEEIYSGLIARSNASNAAYKG